MAKCIVVMLEAPMTVPLEMRAQLNPFPPASAVALVTPEIGENAAVPLLVPEHCTVPPLRMTQVEPSALLTLVAPVIPVIGTGLG